MCQQVGMIRDSMPPSRAGLPDSPFVHFLFRGEAGLNCASLRLEGLVTGVESLLVGVKAPLSAVNLRFFTGVLRRKLMTVTLEEASLGASAGPCLGVGVRGLFLLFLSSSSSDEHTITVSVLMRSSLLCVLLEVVTLSADAISSMRAMMIFNGGGGDTRAETNGAACT